MPQSPATPSCIKCQAETKFRLAVPVVRDMSQVLVYECGQCNVLAFYRFENGALRSWP